MDLICVEFRNVNIGVDIRSSYSIKYLLCILCENDQPQEEIGFVFYYLLNWLAFKNIFQSYAKGRKHSKNLACPTFWVLKGQNIMCSNNNALLTLV